MTRIVVAAFLIAHGFVHMTLYVMPKQPAKPPPFDPSRSWALAAAGLGAGPMRGASVALGLAAAATYTAAGWLVILDANSWTAAASTAAVVGLALKGLWFTHWLTLGIALDIGVLAAVIAAWPNGL